jgi:hypothetical protein
LLMLLVGFLSPINCVCALFNVHDRVTGAIYSSWARLQQGLLPYAR